MQQEQFEFARRRDFGEVVGDGLQFIIRNFKSLFTGFLMYVGPLVLLSVFTQRGFADMLNFDPYGEVMPSFRFSTNLLVYLLAMLGSWVMLVTFAYSAIQKSQEQPDETLLDNLWPYIKRNIWRVVLVVIVVTALFFFLAFFFFSMMMMSGLGGIFLMFFVFIPVAIYLWVPLSLLTFVYLVEEGDLTDAFRRSFYLVKGNWWNTFAVLLVIAIVAVIASSIFSIPALAVGFAETWGTGADPLNPSTSPLAYALGALGSLGSMFAAIYQLTGVALQYYNLRELKDGVSLMDRIEQIDESDDMV
ncbi:MAG: hypothetical protein R3301_03675 [Saprospiraceae bacterium]|nr:hypothetical protein [Saprospiraceae bacterium]